jgi:hypothetical protein
LSTPITPEIIARYLAVLERVKRGTTEHERATAANILGKMQTTYPGIEAAVAAATAAPPGKAPLFTAADLSALLDAMKLGANVLRDAWAQTTRDAAVKAFADKAVNVTSSYSERTGKLRITVTIEEDDLDELERIGEDSYALGLLSKLVGQQVEGEFISVVVSEDEDEDD